MNQKNRLQDQQMPESKSSKRDRSNTEYLSLFLYTVEGYRRITDNLPINWNKDHYKIKSHEEYAAISTRALLLRKYITKSDNVYLKTVTEKAKAILQDKEPELTSIYKEYTDAHDKEIRQTLEDGTELNLRQTFDDLVYGIFLHADFERSSRLTKSSEQMRFYCMRKFVHSIETSVFRLNDFLLMNNVKALPKSNIYQKAPVVAILGQAEKRDKSITGYWSNLYGKDVETDKITDEIHKGKSFEEMQIM